MACQIYSISKKQLSKEKCITHASSVPCHPILWMGWDWGWVSLAFWEMYHSFQFFGEIFVLVSVRLHTQHTQWLFVNECKFVDYWSLEDSRMRRNYKINVNELSFLQIAPWLVTGATYFTAASVKFIPGCQDASSFG